MDVEANKEIRRAVDTGTVVFGTKMTKKKILAGEGQMVIISNNVPVNEKETIKQLAGVEGKKFYEYDGTGLVLGSVCGKPFTVSVMTIVDAGKSKVLEL